MNSFPLDSYQVGILCALPLEKAAVEAALDEEHDRPQGIPEKDEHSYTFGRIGIHNVVIACLPDGMTGKASAANVGTDVMRTFPIKVGLMVGIGGGAPSKANDIRLGDVVVGRPQGVHGGVIQYDFGKELPNGFSRTNTLSKPPPALLSALAGLRAKHERPKWNKMPEHLAKITEEMGTEYQFPGAENDVLFESTYNHVGGAESACDAAESSQRCDFSRVVQRPERKNPSVPVIHYGNVASADKVMRHAPERDRIAKELSALCFEMEAAGLDENFRCLVIRGICDYSDSHKHKGWQRYAASTAAAFAKELLSFIRPQGLDGMKPAGVSKETAISTVDIKTRKTLSAPSNENNKKWLMIYDNVDRDWTRGNDRDAYEINDFLPDCDHGNVIVTTRLSNLLGSKKRLRLDRVSNEQAQRILEARAGKSLPDAQPLIERLGGLPLALAQAGCFLRKPLTVSKYLEMYEQTWTRLMHSQQQFPLEEYLERSLLTTWVLSYEQVLRESPTAAGVLRLWAYLDNADLWFDLLAVSSAEVVELQWPMWYSSLVHDELTFHDRMNVLLAYSLASVSASGEGYSVHRVVHDWTRHQIGTAIERGQLYQMAIYLISTHTDSADEELERRLLPHARQVAKNIQPGCTETAIESLSRIAELLDNWDESAVSARLYEHILAVCQTTLGPDHDRTLRITGIAADVHTKAGLGAHASVLYKRALESYRSRDEERSADALDTLHRLAVLDRDHGQPDFARSRYEEALRGYEDLYGHDHEKTYLIANEIARSCYRVKSRRTLELLELSLQGKKSRLGRSHWRTVVNSYQLGHVQHQRKSYPRAEEYFGEALEFHEVNERRRKWIDTRFAIPALWCLSTMYMRQKRFQETEDTLLRLRKLIVDYHGTKEDTFTAPMHLLSWVYRHLNKLEEAEEVLTHLLDLHGAAFGIENEDSNHMLMELGRVRLRMGKLKDAFRSFERAGEVANEDTGDAQAHVQSSIEFCRKHFLSERELRVVLASLDYPDHADSAIDGSLDKFVTERIRSQEAKRLSYISRLPVPTSSKATSPSAGSKKSPVTARTSTPSKPRGFRFAAGIEESQSTPSGLSSKVGYCDQHSRFNCDVLASSVSPEFSSTLSDLPPGQEPIPDRVVPEHPLGRDDEPDQHVYVEETNDSGLDSKDEPDRHVYMEETNDSEPNPEDDAAMKVRQNQTSEIPMEREDMFSKELKP
ncbi:hypothetical protein PRZ48_003996 [Zasmidium cellare]|uniref:Nucleoside phosphorylase domain-containing protein n=1 Tax=Zasmidium cellare TaxID=395010 RepID=A0ABR0EY61_ZASCE|nr:hypothetical protein PRZ48_003996 [Zasmidium cellare]